MKGNKIGDKGVKALCQSLMNLNVHTLNLSYNNITWNSIACLVDLAEQNNKLRVLDIKSNNIEAKMMERVSMAFKNCQVRVEI